MALPTVVINKTKIKFRFAEPYTSEASNFQTGINDVGVYRGGTVEVYGASPSKSIRILTDGTATVALHRNADGYGTIVNETSQPILDLTSAITWPIAAGGLDLYVYLFVDYDVDAETAGIWGIAESGDLPSGAVKLAMLELPESATEILASYIRTDGDYRDKILSKKGVLVPKIASIGTGSSRARFQITDRVSCLGTSPAGWNYSRSVMLLDNTYPGVPLTDGTSNEALVSASYWYAASSGGSALTLSDMDEDGCYTNPYIDFIGVATFDSAFKVAYYSYVSLDSIDLTDTYLGFVYPHANRLKSSAINGIVDTVDAGSISDQLYDMLNLIGDKISILSTSVPSSTWVLLWRSNNVGDLLVDGDTLSLYHRDTGILICKGGYISGTDFKVNAVVTNPSTNLYCHSIYGDRIGYRSVYRAGPATLGLEDETDWAYFSFRNETARVVYNTAESESFDEYKTVTMSGVPHVGSNARYIEIFNIAENEIRIYFSAAGVNTSLMICSGCYWDDATDKWKGIGTSYNAIQLGIGRYGLTIKQKDHDDSDFSTGWAYTDSWTGEWTFASGLSAESIFKIKGEITESSIVPFNVTLNSRHIAAMSDSDYVGPTLNSFMNFRAYRYTEPLDTDFSFAKNGSGATITNITVTYIGHWGAKITGDIDLTAYMSDFTVESTTASPPTIRVANASAHNWQPGQLICVRGSTYNDIWTVTDAVIDGTSVDLAVDNSVTAVLGSSAPRTLYTVFQEDENTEIEAFYVATVY